MNGTRKISESRRRLLSEQNNPEAKMLVLSANNALFKKLPSGNMRPSAAKFAPIVSSIHSFRIRYGGGHEYRLAVRGKSFVWVPAAHADDHLAKAAEKIISNCDEPRSLLMLPMECFLTWSDVRKIDSGKMSVYVIEPQAYTDISLVDKNSGLGEFMSKDSSGLAVSGGGEDPWIKITDQTISALQRAAKKRTHSHSHSHNSHHANKSPPAPNNSKRANSGSGGLLSYLRKKLAFF